MRKICEINGVINNWTSATDRAVDTPIKLRISNSASCGMFEIEMEWQGLSKKITLPFADFSDALCEIEDDIIKLK